MNWSRSITVEMRNQGTSMTEVKERCPFMK